MRLQRDIPTNKNNRPRHFECSDALLFITDKLMRTL